MIALSTHRLAPATGILREPPRPPELRNADYSGSFDWDTVFYDVYRSGRHVVFQGPPFLNLLDHLKSAVPFKRAFGFPRFCARHYGQCKRGEIWLRSDADHFTIDSALGHFAITVQPDMADRFARRRVVTTISKNNDLRWLADWVRFYVRIHGADGILLYDNGSTAYSLSELQATLDEAGEGMPALAVSWPFPFGPQGGFVGGMNGKQAPWDSDFCQIGSLQHARFRFLSRARSVLNVDIDEMVLGENGGSIFAATEASPASFIKFPGRWITTYAPAGADRETCRHADFTHHEKGGPLSCPPKWCVVPGRGDKRADSWSIHNLFGARGNKSVSDDWHFRHKRGITTSWKEKRWRMNDATCASELEQDQLLAHAYRAAGLEHGGAS